MSRLAPGSSLLVRLPTWLGDWVMAEPAVASLARARRDGRLGALSLAGPGRFFELVEGRFEGVRRLADEERWPAHDAALLLDGSLRSAARAWRAGIGTRWSWFTGGRGLLATAGARPAFERGAVALHVRRRGRFPRRLPRPFGAACAELCGAMGIPVVERAPRLSPVPVGEAAASARLASLGLGEGQPFVALDASARPGSSKGAPPELWAAVLEDLDRRGAPPVLVLAAPGEEEPAKRIGELARAAGPRLVTDPPPTLPELLSLVARSELYLGADSGPRHLAVATSRPLVVLFGPTDPRHTADHLERTTSLRLELDCAPCHLETCPLSGGDRGACLSRIEPDRVAAAVLDRLEASGALP